MKDWTNAKNRDFKPGIGHFKRNWLEYFQLNDVNFKNIAYRKYQQDLSDLHAELDFDD